MIKKFIDKVTDLINNQGKFDVIIEGYVWNASHNISPEDISVTQDGIIICDTTGGIYCLDAKQIEINDNIFGFYMGDQRVRIIF